MKPISIKFKCFGPYMEEQFIDFRELEKSGLFLICGQTGSGKTTILDAICCALYGQSSGGGRGGLEEIRCKQAAQADTTMVEYIFSSGANTYRFYRAIKPKKQHQKSLEAGKPQSFNDEYECQILRDGEFVPMADTKATKTYINNRAEEILGLKYDQFRQVVILPQGQFEKLLTSESSEKEKILETLFHTQRWSKIAALVFEKASQEKGELERRQAELDAKMQVFGCDSLEALRVLTQATEEEAEKLKNELEERKKTTKRYNEAHEKAKAEDKKFRDLDDAKTKLTGLEKKSDAMETKRTKLAHAKKAENIQPKYAAWQDAADDAKKAAEAHSDRVREKATADGALEEILREQEEHEEKRPEYEKKKDSLAVLNEREELYRSLSGKKQAKTNADGAQKKAETKLDKAKTHLEEMERKLGEAVGKQETAAKAYEQGMNAYLRGIGGILAQKLEEGQKCPVCGSIHHPEPACIGEDHISEKELEQLKKNNQDAMDAVTTATKNYNSAVTEKQNAALELETRKGEAKQAAQSYDEALAQRVEGIDTEAQRAAKVKELKEEIEAFETADEDMSDRVNRVKGDAQTAEVLAKAAKAAAEQKEEDEQTARSEWEKVRKDKFKTDEAYLAACMETEKRDELHGEIVQYDTDLGNAKQGVEDQKKALGDAVRPDVEGAKEQLEQAEREKNETDHDYILKDKSAKDQRTALESLEKDLPVLEQAQLHSRENLEFAKRLRGDSGVSLQRYVLGVMLTAITAQANRLLKTVYGGRYQLYRTDEASGSAHKKGLELVVVDRDGSRAVTSLSGGEKFLLSLSLAIGLAGVVQAQGKGVHLEAMFIDEGFGSLDSSCINDAMEILESVRRSSGIVGIISHVDRLAETIPAKIEITKTNHGSTCKVSC